MWTPDKELVEAATVVVDEESRRLLDPVTVMADAVLAVPKTGMDARERMNLIASETLAQQTGSATALLEAIGTLAACDEAPVALTKVGASLRDALSSTLERLELPELDDAALHVLENAPLCLTMDESSLDEIAEPILEALRTRDRVELLFLGAETLGLARAVSDEAHASRDSFDALVGPELWQLVPLGERRSIELEWMSPTLKARFWWRSRGAELGADALDDRSLRAVVLAIFPEAWSHLDALEAMLPKTGTVVDLRSLFERKRRAHQVTATGQLRAAAAGGSAGASEVPVLGTSVVELGLTGSTLIIDVIADLAEGQSPELVGSERLEARAVPDTVQRFSVELAERHLDATNWKLVLPLRLGRVEIPLDDVDGE